MSNWSISRTTPSIVLAALYMGMTNERAGSITLALPIISLARRNRCPGRETSRH
jgi:hypothetical protein